MDFSSLDASKPFFDYFGFQQVVLRELGIDHMVPYTNLGGQLQLSSADLGVLGYDDVACVRLTSGSDGGAINASTFTLAGTKHVTGFVANSSRQNGGAIYVKTNCSITNNFSPIYFIGNVSLNSTGNCFGGAIYSGNSCSISNNYAPILFSCNMSRVSGGAIASKTFSLSNNKELIVFAHNYSYVNNDQSGGGVFSRLSTGSGSQVLIEGNMAPVQFISNQGTVGGCFLVDSCILRNNLGGVSFLNNASWYGKNGGVVYTANLIIQDNRSALLFSSNITEGNGGVAYCTNCNISGNGPVSFINNRAVGSGGAIYTQQGGNERVISADYGDITFSGNCCQQTNGIYFRNACSINASTTLRARKGRSILFYDPVLCDHSPTITVNSDVYSGTVLFSSVNVPYSLVNEGNYTSKCGHINVKGGVLAIEDGAVLSCMSLNTSGDGGIRLGQNGTLRTFNSSSTLTCSNLALHLPSLLRPNASPAKIFNENLAVSSTSISGNLRVSNEVNSSPYESMDLSCGLTRVAFLELVDKTGKEINTTALNVEAINETNHYGYLGKWTPYWEEYMGTETTPLKHRVLYANWAPIGYVPNPKFQANLVANALWESFYIADSNLHEYSVFSRHFGVYGGARGLIHYQYDRSGVPGFHLKTSGYSVGTYASIDRDHRFSLNFGQYFSQMKEQGRPNELSSKNYSIGFKAHSHWFSHLFSTTISGVYSYGKHVVDHEYQDEGKASTGDFYSNTYGLSVRVGLPVTRVTRKTTVSPFVEMLGVRSTFASFTEEGDYARAFSVEHPLYEVESPVGVRGKFHTYRGLSSEWEAELAYRPTLYRQRPLVTTRLLASNGTWSTKGSPTAHQAVSYRLSHKANLSKHLLMMLNYQGVLSTTTFCNYLQAGMQAQF